MSTSKVIAALCATAALSAGVGLAYCFKQLHKAQAAAKHAEEKMEVVQAEVDVLTEQLTCAQAEAKTHHDTSVQLYDMCEKSVTAMQRNGDLARKFLLAWRRTASLHASVLDTLAMERQQPTSDTPQYMVEGSLGYIAHRLKSQLNVRNINGMLADLGIDPLGSEQANISWLSEPH